MKIRYIILSIIISASLLSCRNTTTPMPNPADLEAIKTADASFETEFISLWEGLNNSYVFWDIDNSDWDSYRPKLIALGQSLDATARANVEEFNSEWRESDSKSKKQITELFKGFIDHHMTIRVINPYISTDERRKGGNANLYINPGLIRVKATRGNNYHEELPFSTYIAALKSTGLISSGEQYALYKTDDGDKVNLFSCVLSDGIPYLHMDGYMLTKILTDDPSSLISYQAQNVVYSFFSHIKYLKSIGKLKGIIIDNRDNGGGYISDLAIVVGAFLNSGDQVTAFRKKTKYGLGKYDIEQSWSNDIVSALTHYSITFSSDVINNIYIGRLTDTPLIVLQNMHSLSMGEISSRAIQSLSEFDNNKNRKQLFGEKTFGGHGNLIFQSYENNNYNGSFNYTNNYDEAYHGVYCVNFVVELFNNKTKQFEMLESKGVAADVYIDANFEKLKSKSDDNQLREAVNYINSLQ